MPPPPPPPPPGDDNLQPEAGASSSGSEALACVSCRSRKLKCNRMRPICSRCAKAKLECVYPESRRKPTFQRRNVRELEARLGGLDQIIQSRWAFSYKLPAQVEDLLKEAGKGPSPSTSSPTAVTGKADGAKGNADFGFHDFAVDPEVVFNPQLDDFDYDFASQPASHDPPIMGLEFTDELKQKESLSVPGRELMNLGLFEALPPFEVMEELYDVKTLASLTSIS